MKKIEVTLHLSTLVAAVCFVVGCMLVVQGIKEVELAQIKQEAILGCLGLGYEEYMSETQQSKAVTVNKLAYEFCMEEINKVDK